MIIVHTYYISYTLQCQAASEKPATDKKEQAVSNDKVKYNFASGPNSSQLPSFPPWNIYYCVHLHISSYQGLYGSSFDVWHDIHIWWVPQILYERWP